MTRINDFNNNCHVKATIHEKKRANNSINSNSEEFAGTPSDSEQTNSELEINQKRNRQ